MRPTPAHTRTRALRVVAAPPSHAPAPTVPATHSAPLAGAMALNDALFNVNDGYLEGLVRGFRNGILTQADYLNLVQCDTLEGTGARAERHAVVACADAWHVADVKLHLQSTSYGNFLANEPSPLAVSTISDKLTEKLVAEFFHVRNGSLEPLTTFLDYISYGYMIDNVILLITGTLHERDLSELLPKCHPLGLFESMGSLTIASNPAELYNSVLIDTPIAPYFISCISEHDLDEVNIEIIRNTLYKAYLTDFNRFCKELGGTTAEVMGRILEVSVRAVRRMRWPARPVLRSH